jgi:hypothetical protein
VDVVDGWLPPFAGWFALLGWLALLGGVVVVGVVGVFCP